MSPKELLANWHNKVKRIQDCHYETSSAYKKKHYLFGLPLVVLSAAAGAGIWAEFPDSQGWSVASRILLSLISLSVTVLAAVQTFLGFEKRGENHYKTGFQFGVMKKKVEVFQSQKHNDQETDAFLAETRQEWDSITEEAPQIPQHIWDRVYKASQRSP